MIAGYIDYYVEPSISKENQFMKYFTDKIRANPVVMHKSAYLLFDELLRAQKEKMLGMYIIWYNTGDNQALVNSPVMDVRLKNISRVMPGQPYIDAVGADTAGVPRSLKEVVKRSKCTLLLFWASDCSHCREEMPFIKEYYEKYHAKGFDVYAISIETDPQKWKGFVTDKKLPWTNVISSRTADPNPAVQYVSLSTPTMILIDGKGTILHRFMPKARLENHIIEALK
jgi:thiol-disulfide isomerase/thioredoxin